MRNTKYYKSGIYLITNKVNSKVYVGYYWKCIEPIICEGNRKEGEFREGPEVDNFEPSTNLNG